MFENVDMSTFCFAKCGHVHIFEYTVTHDGNGNVDMSSVHIFVFQNVDTSTFSFQNVDMSTFSFEMLLECLLCLLQC